MKGIKTHFVNKHFGATNVLKSQQMASVVCHVHKFVGSDFNIFPLDSQNFSLIKFQTSRKINNRDTIRFVYKLWQYMCTEVFIVRLLKFLTFLRVGKFMQAELMNSNSLFSRLFNLILKKIPWILRCYNVLY